MTWVAQLDVELPDYVPVLGYGLRTKAALEPLCPVGSSETHAVSQELPALLSKVLVALALDFERESEVSLAIQADLLRLLGERPARLRDLPRLSGVSKEAVSMAIGFLE